MSILVKRSTQVLIQGITGKEGRFHTGLMLAYGTKVVAGTTPGRGGSQIEGVPVYDSVMEAQKLHGIDASVIFVPPSFAGDAIMEALEAGIKILVCITEGIPIQDMVKIRRETRENEALLIGPNSPGIITVGESKLGIMPAGIFAPGNVGLISRSGTLTYQVVDELTRAGIGQTTCVGIGGDPILGTTFREMLQLYSKDPSTHAVVLIGEIGGPQEEDAAEYISTASLPVVAFIAGKSAPPGKRMGHAGAIVLSGKGTAAAKIEAFRDAHVPVAETTSEIVTLIRQSLSARVPA